MPRSVLTTSSTTLTLSSPPPERIDSTKEVKGTRSPIAASNSSSTCLTERVWEHLTATVTPSIFVEVELLVLTFCTGLQDAISFPDFHCFASNQTGNTIFLMLAIILPELNGTTFVTANIGVALGLFLAAGWLTGQLSHIIGPQCRLWLIACNFIQTCLVFAAAAMQYVYDNPGTGTHALIIVGLLAFASGSQVVQSRSMAMTEISTAMATAAWVDLMMDPKLFVLDNRPRTRRIAFLIVLALGGLFGAYLYKTVGSAAAIMVSGAGKFLVTIMYFFNQAEKKKLPSVEEGR